MGRKFKIEGICVYVQLIHFSGQHKLTQHYKVTIFLPGKSPWTEEPGGLQSWGCKELDTTEQLNTHTHTHIPMKIESLKYDIFLLLKRNLVPCFS